MRILTVHCWYRQRGGEGAVFLAETAMLRRRGHQVLHYVEDNRRIAETGRLALAAGAVWSESSRRRLLRALSAARPDLVHFHNTFPLISASGYHACREAGVPVVQTLHNYRLVCPAGTLFRDGHACTDCLGKAAPWPAVVHACYRESRSQTTVVAAMLVLHRLLGTYRNRVDMYVCPSEFSRRMLVRGGVRQNRARVKPNFVHPDPGQRRGRGEYALFAGRLSPEKGVLTMLQAWRSLRQVPLRIAGTGPLTATVRAAARRLGGTQIEVCGRCGPDRVAELMKEARLLVFPSVAYETFGRAVAEAFACGLPVVAPRHGAMLELVEDGCTGRLFRPGDAQDLSDKVAWLWSHPAEAERMGREARAEYEARYTEEHNYPLLVDIYRQVLRGGGTA